MNRWARQVYTQHQPCAIKDGTSNQCKSCYHKHYHQTLIVSLWYLYLPVAKGLDLLFGVEKRPYQDSFWHFQIFINEAVKTAHVNKYQKQHSLKQIQIRQNIVKRGASVTHDFIQFITMVTRIKWRHHEIALETR